MPRQQSDSFRDLARRTRSRRTDWDEVLDWVFEHAMDDPSLLDPEEIPCRGAVGYLQHVQSSGEAYAELIKACRERNRGSSPSSKARGRAQGEPPRDGDPAEEALAGFESLMLREGVLDECQIPARAADNPAAIVDDEADPCDQDATSEPPGET